MRHRRTVLLAACALAVIAAAAPTVRADDAWSALAAARAGFEGAAWTADFVQTWVPAGFSTGESESGTVSLALPGALRWDYETPYPKSLLVKLDTAYSWNPGEASGRRILLAPEEREQLALLELDLATLRRRFSAAVQSAPDERIEIALTPLEDGNDVRQAQLTLDALSHRLIAMGYSDVEGNRTEFAFSGHRPVAGADPFTPPAGLEWLDD
jgi:outer membrane lipoprotein carrier protein